MSEENSNCNWCEIELGDKTKKFFIHVQFEPFEIWCDSSALPYAAFLCASLDGVGILKSSCGEKGDLERYLLPMEWLINDWAGDEKFVDALKKRKQKIIKDLPKLREKYCV